MSRIPTPEAIVVPVQAMITAFYENRVDYLALEDIQQYFENDGWDALLAASYEVLLLNLSQLADEIFRDDLACECLGSKARGSLSQQERVAFARAKIIEMVDELDDRLTPSIVCCSLVDSQGRSVVIGGYTEIHGQAGPHTHWVGVFRTEKALLTAFRKQGLILLSEIGSISDAEILSLWRPA